MTLGELSVWATTIGPHDHRTWCGKDVSVAEVKRAVQELGGLFLDATLGQAEARMALRRAGEDLPP